MRIRKPEMNHKKEKKKKEQKEPKNWLHGLWLNWLKPIGIAVLVVFSFRSTFADWNDVPTASMEPTILTGDRIFVNKLAYDLKFPFTTWHLLEWGGPKRGDIVVFFAPEDGKRMVKRVIGLPGDVIEGRNNDLFINGEPVLNTPANQGKYTRLDLHPKNPLPIEFWMETVGNVVHPIMYVGQVSSFRTFGPTEIPEDKYLMMGDNRNNSKDSRLEPNSISENRGGIGLIPRNCIVGRAFGVAFSVDKHPSLSIRWDRILEGFDQHDADAQSD